MSYCTNCGSLITANARFCAFCGAKVTLLNNEERETKINNSLRICPFCGAPVNSYTTCCSACGNEVHDAVSSLSCVELCKKLDEIEASRPEPQNGIFATIFKRKRNSDSLEPMDMKKLQAIQNHFIPNNKIDILDFILLAESRVSSSESLYEFSEDDYDSEYYEQLMEVWDDKLDEALNKGEILLKNDPEFIRIRDRLKTQKYIARGLCRYCGGEFKGRRNKVCSKCGRQKDY